MKTKTPHIPGKNWRFLAFDDGKKIEMQNEGIFDELVVDDWLHIEQMSANTWWMRIGEATVWVDVVGRKNPPIVRITCDETAGAPPATPLVPLQDVEKALCLLMAQGWLVPNVHTDEEGIITRLRATLVGQQAATSSKGEST